MGEGNFLPPEEVKLAGYAMVYITEPFFDDVDEHNYSAGSEEWREEFKTFIGDTLPGSFYHEPKAWRWENGTTIVQLYPCDSYNHHPLVVYPKVPYGIRHMQQTARRLFDALAANDYRVTVRDGGYCQSPYVPSNRRLSNVRNSA